ncbi:hypothetical protein EB796_008095 [Bugula neritina]|uniref:Fibrinogen C-terminal domain-containing protein n=1 Tax=Bugula neritina TaxID=10212 RepID=A0A7J7K7R1_BUGNE|nr:hypothetical protein EB796_008095 [Bugula neritina]
MYDEVQLMINVLPRDCDDVYKRELRSSGVQLIKPGPAHSAVEVYCDIDIESGRGWSVLQQRHSGELDFNKNWTEYREGFGEVRVDKEFWVGNELIHTLTSQYNYTVRFDMWAVNGSYIYAEYTNFKLLSESEGYKLLVSGYSGNATDSLRHSNDMSFSTYEVDNDRSSTHCALFYTAGCNIQEFHKLRLFLELYKFILFMSQVYNQQ